MIKPTGWHTVKYPDKIEDLYLYNRGHMIGYQLSGENANEQNLLTITRYMNVEGMLPFENWVAEYVRETNNHVLYRVTPIFEGDNIVVPLLSAMLNQNKEYIVDNVNYEIMKEMCVSAFDTNRDGELSYEEAAAVTALSVMKLTDKSVKSFDEFQYFTSVKFIPNELVITTG